jgi:hypothetical protein
MKLRMRRPQRADMARRAAETAATLARASRRAAWVAAALVWCGSGTTGPDSVSESDPAASPRNYPSSNPAR